MMSESRLLPMMSTVLRNRLKSQRRNASAEEVEYIAGLVSSLVQTGVNWIDDKGRRRPLQLTDILVVAPYNAQVSDLSKRVPNAQVGTVDKFQGQHKHRSSSTR